MTYNLRRVVFTAPEQARIESAAFAPYLEPDAVRLRTHWSLISTGTELTIYTNRRDIGGRSANPYPATPGYAAMGVVEAVGSSIRDLAPGDRVMAATGHASRATFRPSQTVWLRLPDDIRDDHAPFIRMALITLATLRQADIRAGEWLGVVGLGIVGNLGAQFGRYAGFKIIGVGRSALRSEIAAQCGIDIILSGEPDAIAERVRDITGGEGCRFVLDTSGTMSGLQKAIALAGDGGAISLVGVPWVSDPTVPATAIMQPVFSHYLTILGGWEWGLPLSEREPDRALPMLPHRHSVARNARYAAECIASRHVQVEPLITHRIAPDDVQDAYQGALHRRDAYLGVLIDWRED